MSVANLLDPILTGGVQDAHFFNGRVLAAEDLADLQKASRLHLRQLGQVLGPGVAIGLGVQALTGPPSQPVLRVTPGIALNRDGDAVQLAAQTDVALVRTDGPAVPSASAFHECLPFEPDPSLTNAGVYVFTIAPAVGFAGRAPKVELQSGGVASGCGSRYEVSGVRFRLVRLDLQSAEAGSLSATLETLANTVLTQLEQAASLSGAAAAALFAQAINGLHRLRNGLAHWCLGTDRLAQFAGDVFARDSAGASPFTAIGALDDLAARKLIDPSEVPLALLFWTQGGLQFVDLWAARRPVAPPAPSPVWPLPVSPRRFADAQAAFLQFQGQIAALMADPSRQSFVAAAHARNLFRFLPPAGFIPVVANGSARGFTPQLFFDHLHANGVTTIAGEKIGEVLFESFLHHPVDISGTVAFQLFEVRENVEAVTTAAPGQRYLLFATRAMERIRRRDRVAQIFEETWQAYRALIRQRAFLPAESTQKLDIAGAISTIITAIQDVMAVANRQAVLAASGMLNYDDSLAALQALYAVQKELATTLAGNIPGTDPAGRVAFATALNTFLDVGFPGSVPGLNPSLTARNLTAALEAQTRINGQLDAGGTGVALGFIEAAYSSSPGGDNIVPGQAFGFRFDVTNHTDRRLVIELEGSVTAPSGNWEGAVEFLDATGAHITTVTLDSTITQQITVRVTAPADAVIGETAELDITVRAGAPHNKVDTASHVLHVAGSSGPPVTRSVQFVQIVPPTASTSNAPPTTLLDYQIDMRFTSAQAGESGTFRIRVEGSATSGQPVSAWSVFFPGSALTNPSAGVWERTSPVGMTAGAANPTRVTVRVSTPARAQQTSTFTFAVTVESSGLPEQLSNTTAQQSLSVAAG